MNQPKIYLPPPLNWQDFQSLVVEIAKCRYIPELVHPYGSPSDRQFGVDIFAEDRFGNKIGIQCKETKVELKQSVITAEADDAMSFTPALNFFIIATTDNAKRELQDHVTNLNDSKKYKFKICLEFWNELVNDINRYAMVLNGCYQMYKQQLQGADEDKYLSCLRIAFDRAAYKDDFALERNYNDFEEAMVCTKRLFRTGFALDRWSQIPIIQTIPIDCLPHGNYRRFVEN